MNDMVSEWPHEIAQAYKLGNEANLEGYGVLNNPYSADDEDELWDAWNMGWLDTEK